MAAGEVDDTVTRAPISTKNLLQGKTVLLTGANSGIGKATAIGLAELGASLVLVCRDERKARAAIEEIFRKTGSRSVELILGDLLKQREVRRVAQQFKAGHKHLDVLINNAGTNFPDYEETEDGIERTMAVNYFAPFLLTNLLLDLLEQSAPARIVNVSSVGHFRGNLDLGNITKDRRMGTYGLAAYNRSKLALVLFTYELARRLEGKHVTVNCLHPGAIRTGIWSHAGVMRPLAAFVSLFMKSPSQGARTSIYLASSPEVKGITGKYYDKCKKTRSSEASYNESTAVRLWNESIILTHLDSRPA